ncbi:hypothetical protein HK104_004805 [Borealophlyctis nickersoniae]|nr:hypothetical protein HK104_004805 [Borealophlyctis nickersoniae]
MPSLTLSLLVSLLAASTAVAQQGPTCMAVCSIQPAAATSSLSTLCKSSPNLPACDLSATSCGSSTSGPCDPTTLLYTACSDDAVPANSPACADIKSQCPCGKAVPELPTAKNASALVYSICTEMPQMANCQPGCPTPDKTTLLSDCKVLEVYGKLCMEMPSMNQCSKWSAFCAANNNVTGICTASAAGTPTGTGTSGSPQPTNKSNSAMAGFAASVIQLAVVLVVGMTVLVA